jgi:hypothetical protein
MRNDELTLQAVVLGAEMNALIGAIVFALASTVWCGAEAEPWRATGGPETPPFMLTLADPIGPGTAYKFECGAHEITVTEVGVTQLLDLKTGQHIRDEPGSTMPDGAATMAFRLGSGEGEFRSATAHSNNIRGWDLTIEIAKDDAAFLKFQTAEFVTLMTTGMTNLIKINAVDRTVIDNFVQRCRAR